MKFKGLVISSLVILLLVSSNNVFSQTKKTNILKKEKSINIEWTEMGPCNYGGRTRAFLVDKTNPNLLFVGVVGGGLWKSNSGGSSWQKVSDTFDNIVISCLHQTQDGTIYFGTGEYFGFDNYPGIRGNGIWKTTDGGNTWQQLTSTDNEDFIYVNKISSYANKLYVATNKGIRISNDGGQTWTNPVPLSDANSLMPATDITVSSDGSFILASLNEKAYMCNNGNDEFVPISSIPTDVIRLVFAISPSNSSHAYCLAVATDGRLKNIYETKDKGNTWNPILSNVTSQFQPFGNKKNKQGRYHCSLAVDPLNEDKIYIGGIDLYSYTPISNFEQISLSVVPSYSSKYIHENIHQITFSPNYSTNNTFYVATDGGIFKTTDKGDSWMWLNKNLNGGDFLNVAITSNNEVVGGTVNNGILHNDLHGNTIQHFFKYLSGTIGSVQRLTINPKFMIVTLTYGKVARTYEGGEALTTSYVTDSIPTAGTNSHSLGTAKEPYLAPIRVYERFYDPNSTNYIQYVVSDTLRLGDTIKAINPYEREIVHKIDSTDLHGHTMLLKGDTIYIKDYYQVLTALGLTNRVWISWNALMPGTTPSWYPVVSNTNIKKVCALEFSSDGDIIYFAAYDSTSNKSNVYRLSNIQSARTKELATYSSPTCVVTSQLLGTFDGKVNGIAVDPSNNENIIVTLANYDNTPKIYYSTNAASTTNDTMEINFVPKQGNLPFMPVYTAIILWNNSQQVMIGTDKGVWFTEDITATDPVWTQQINGMANVPVSHIVQQLHTNGWLANSNLIYGGIQTGVENHGVIYAATRGRGIFRCENFRGPVSVPNVALSNTSTFLIYPNPTSDYVNVKFENFNESNVEISIYDLNGKILLNKKFNSLSKGIQTITIPVSRLNSGTYIVSLKSKDGQFLNKLIIH